MILVLFGLVHFELIAFNRLESYGESNLFASIQQHSLDLLLIFWHSFKGRLNKLAPSIADLRRQLVNSNIFAFYLMLEIPFFAFELLDSLVKLFANVHKLGFAHRVNLGLISGSLANYASSFVGLGLLLAFQLFGRLSAQQSPKLLLPFAGHESLFGRLRSGRLESGANFRFFALLILALLALILNKSQSIESIGSVSFRNRVNRYSLGHTTKGKWKQVAGPKRLT